MELHAAFATDRGLVRPQNEDAVLAEPPLIAVADGMGGHRAGEVASNLALEQLAGWKERLEGLSGLPAAQKLREAFTDINRVVFEKGQSDEAQQGMGTTLTAGWIEADTLSLAHVGDSRAYLLRGEELVQLTEDQNRAQDLVRRGRLSEKEAATSPLRHVVLQAIGVDDEQLDIETSSVSLQHCDRVVLASDGLFGMLRDNERLRDILVEHPNRDEACVALIEAANAAGGEDNISVVVIDVVGDPAAVVAAGDGAADLVIERDEPIAKAPRRARRVPRLAWAAGGAVVLFGAMVLVPLIARASSTYILSAQGDEVVVLEGHLGSADEPPIGDVVHTFTDVELDDFAETTQDDLRAPGIQVDSISDADATVDGLPRFIGPKDTPTPEPEESPKTTKKPSSKSQETPSP